MRSCMLIISLACVALTATGSRRSIIQSRNNVSASGGPDACSTCTNETFEGAGYVLTGWSEAGSIVNEDYATAPAPLVGSQSLLVRNSSGGFDTAYSEKNGDSAVESWFRFAAVITNALPNQLYIAAIADSGGTAQAYIMVTNSTVRVFCGTATAATSGTISFGTLTYFWFHYAKGSGANAVADIGFSTSKTRPTGGANFAQTTTGTSTANSQIFRLGGGDGKFVGAYGGIIFDSASFTSIGVIGDFP